MKSKVEVLEDKSFKPFTIAIKIDTIEDLKDLFNSIGTIFIQPEYEELEFEIIGDKAREFDLLLKLKPPKKKGPKKKTKLQY